MPGIEREKHIEELIPPLKESKSNIYVEPIQSNKLYSVAKVNINSEGNYFEVYLYHKKRKLMRFFRSRNVPPVQACFEEKDVTDKILYGNIGAFHFYAEECDIGHVAHETYHAIERSKDWLIEWSLKGEHRFESVDKEEESLAAIMGFLTKEIYNWIENELEFKFRLDN